MVCYPAKLTEAGCSSAPDWIVEVLSPSTARSDRVQKLFLYQETGVKEYWIADLEDPISDGIPARKRRLPRHHLPGTGYCLPCYIARPWGKIKANFYGEILAEQAFEPTVQSLPFPPK